MSLLIVNFITILPTIVLVYVNTKAYTFEQYMLRTYQSVNQSNLERNVTHNL